MEKNKTISKRGNKILTMTENSSMPIKVTVLGIGNAGVKIAKTLSTLNSASWLTIGIADTDESSLKKNSLPNTFPIGFEWTRGQGCGGDILKGERAFAHPSRDKISDFISGSSLLIITGGMGGGTTTGGTPVLARLAKKMKIPTIFVVTTPFSFEGHSKREISENGVKMLIPDADVVIPIPNDILYSSLSPDTSAESAFEKADIEIARVILGIAEIIRCKNLLAADFSDFKTMLNKHKTTCCIGMGSASRDEGENCFHLALERLIKSPLLGGCQQISSADAALLTITGGPELNIVEMKKILESVERYAGSKTKLIVGANTDASYKNNIQITLITIQYDFSMETSPNYDFSPSYSQGSISSMEIGTAQEAFQDELPLQNISKGIFTNTSRNIYWGEDLDIPTFQRLGIHLDKGK